MKWKFILDSFYHNADSQNHTNVGALPMTSWKNCDISAYQSTSPCYVMYYKHTKNAPPPPKQVSGFM